MSQANSRIDVRIEAGRRKYSSVRLKRAAVYFLKKLKRPHTMLSIYLVDDRKIRIFNRKYLRHDRATDVIAFSQTEGVPLKAAGSLAGDIVISLETAERQAREYGANFDTEVLLYLCHGILHLMGYRDKKRTDYRKMWHQQRKLLTGFGLQIPPLKG